MAWTLQYLTTEQPLDAWGFSQDPASCDFFNQAPDILTLAVPGGSITDDPIFPFEANVILRRDRTFNGVAWVGGSIEFQGVRTNHILDGRPDFEGCLYQFAGPWYFLEQTPYQQTYKYYNGDPNNLATGLNSDVVLFQKVTGPATIVARNNGQQISDICQHLLDQATAQGFEPGAFRIGTIDVAVTLPTYQAKDMKCSEAIANCLRCSPNARVWFDYTTSPPTLNVTSQGNAVPVSVAIADGVKHETIRLVARNDLVPRAVVIYFKRSNTENGYTWVETVKQAYPANGIEGGNRCLVQTVDLQGYSRNRVVGHLDVTPIPNPQTRAFWQKYIQEFKSNKIRNLRLGPYTYTDTDTGFVYTLDAPTFEAEDGTPIDTTVYPNVLDDGSNIASWMTIGANTPVVGIRAIMKADASYYRYDAESGGRLVEKFIHKQLIAHVTLTNGINGDYYTTSNAIDGEAVPSGMAQAIYDATSTLQYEGTITLVESEVTAGISLGNVLNLTGGRSEWATMAAQIQSLRRDYGAGRTTITVGPAKHLGAGELTSLFLINRFRRVYENPLTQASAQSSVRGSLTLGTKTAKENTNTGLPQPSVFAVMSANSDGNQNQIVAQAEQGLLSLRMVDSSNLPYDRRVDMQLSDLPSGTLVKFRWFYYNDAVDCTPKKVLVLCSDPQNA